ncbi:hypothetical protein [Sphingomonas arantia]
MTKPTALVDALSLLPPTPLPALPAGWHPKRYAITVGGKLAVAACNIDIDAERTRILAAEDPPSRLQELLNAGRTGLMVLGDAGWYLELSIELETPHSLIDRFADGRWLVVGGRTDAKSNARVFGPDGTLLNRFLLGDGIQDIGIDSVGRIWVSWFDEGIAGPYNEKWRVAGEERPPSSRGIGCFDATGAFIPLPPIPEVGRIDDCYALTVTGDEAWACPYTEFPLLRLSPNQPVRWWTSELAGPSAVAIDGSCALVAGGYEEDASRLALVSLEGGGEGESVRLLARYDLPLRRRSTSANASKPDWDRPTLLAGRGDMLHLVDDGVWRRWRVSEVLANHEHRPTCE